MGLYIQTVESFLLLVVFLTFVKKFFFINLHFLQLWKKLRPGIVLTASRTARTSRTSRTETNYFNVVSNKNKAIIQRWRITSVLEVTPLSEREGYDINEF